jgi:hypothetical protein
MYTSVRITATRPAYSTEGNVIFWNYYAAFYRDAFTNDTNGGRAVEAAYKYPLYVFPSATVKNSDRQAAMIMLDAGYEGKNPLGLAAVVLVEFSQRILTKQDALLLRMLTQRNGTSLDGTPIIRTAKELEDLTTQGLVTQRYAGEDSGDRLPFAVAKVISSPEFGGITSDAFLVYVKQADGQSLSSERHIVDKFECLRSGNAQCF